LEQWKFHKLPLRHEIFLLVFFLLISKRKSPYNQVGGSYVIFISVQTFCNVTRYKCMCLGSTSSNNSSSLSHTLSLTLRRYELVCCFNLGKHRKNIHTNGIMVLCVYCAVNSTYELIGNFLTFYMFSHVLSILYLYSYKYVCMHGCESSSGSLESCWDLNMLTMRTGWQVRMTFTYSFLTVTQFRDFIFECT
jgi:hypothetical protein